MSCEFRYCLVRVDLGDGVTNDALWPGYRNRLRVLPSGYSFGGARARERDSSRAASRQMSRAKPSELEVGRLVLWKEL